MVSHVAEVEGPTTRIYNYVLGAFGEEKEKKNSLATAVSSEPIFKKKKDRKSPSRTLRYASYTLEKQSHQGIPRTNN